MIFGGDLSLVADFSGNADDILRCDFLNDHFLQSYKLLLIFRQQVNIILTIPGYDVHLASAEQTDDECEGADSWCAWWVWWEGGRLSVGRGAAPSERRLLVWPLANDMRIKFVGFSALWGDKADFR